MMQGSSGSRIVYTWRERSTKYTIRAWDESVSFQGHQPELIHEDEDAFKKGVEALHEHQLEAARRMAEQAVSVHMLRSLGLTRLCGFRSRFGWRPSRRQWRSNSMR